MVGGKGDSFVFKEQRAGSFRGTYSFFNLAEFFELLAKGTLLGVPCQAATSRKCQ